MSVSVLPPRGRVAVLVLFAAAGLALLAQFAVYVDYAAALLRFPYDYDQGEGFELYDTVLHAQGQWPYRDSQVYPFYTSIYPPVFHVMTVPLVWAFGPQLWTGRLVGFLASLAAAAALGWGVQRTTENSMLGALSGLTFLASNYTFHIGPLFRQHMTMVMFEAVGIVALAQLDRAGGPSAWMRRPAFWIGLAGLLAAGYTKQLALATVLAGLFFLFLRSPRRGIAAGVGLAAAAGLVFVWINLATHGQWYVSIIRANINAFDSAQALQFYKQWLSLHALIAMAAAARLIYETYFGRLSAYAVWFVFAVGNGALSGKFGAGESYFVTATAAACVLSGIGLARLWQSAARRPAGVGANVALAMAIGLAIPVIYLVQTRLTLHMPTRGRLYEPVARVLGVWRPSGYYDSQGYTQLGPHPTAADIAAGDAITELARGVPGPVFSEEAAFVLRAGKPVVTNPFPQLVMYQAGLFDPSQEIAMINARAFDLVILRAQFYPPPVLIALGENYRPDREVVMNGFIYRILVPRQN